MSRTLAALLTAAFLVPGAGALAGCATDDAAREDTEEVRKDLDDAAGDNDEKAKDAADDAVDAVDDDDGK